MSSFRGVAQRSTSYAGKVKEAPDGYFEHIATYKDRSFEAEHNGKTHTAKHKDKTYEAE